MPLWFLFSLPMLYHIVVEDRQKVGWPVHDWLPEASALCCMEVPPYCSLAMRRRYPAEGECVRRFGDRDDGHLLRSLSCIFAVSPYLMKTRNIAQNYIRDAVEIARAEQDITQKRAAGMEHFGLLHVRLAVYVRTDLCPGPGDRGEHDRQKEMSPDTVIKLRFDPSDTADVVYQRFNAKVQEVKNVLRTPPSARWPARSIWCRVCC